MNRRDFLKLFGSLIGVGVVGTPVVSYFYPPKLEEMPTWKYDFHPTSPSLVGMEGN